MVESSSDGSDMPQPMVESSSEDDDNTPLHQAAETILFLLEALPAAPIAMEQKRQFWAARTRNKISKAGGGGGGSADPAGGRQVEGANSVGSTDQIWQAATELLRQAEAADPAGGGGADPIGEFTRMVEDMEEAEMARMAAVGGDGGDGSAGVPTADAERAEMAVVGGDGGAGSAGVFTTVPDAMMEVSDLRRKQAWTDFVGAVRVAINGEPRRALAQHVTRVAGPSARLRTTGVEYLHETHGVHECRIALKALLEPGDGNVLNYVSEGRQSKKLAQKAAFVEVLSYILFRGPRHLRTHWGQWRADLLEALRCDAEVGLRGRLGPRPRGERWSPLSSPPPDGETPGDRDVRILQAIRNNGYSEIPPGGLLAFLQRFPDEFTIISANPLVWVLR